MLNRRRRYFALLALLLIAAPLIVGLVAPDSPASVLKEGRRLAPAPRLPATGADWLALPAALDAYLNDHFGLRQALIRAHKDLTKPMLGMGDSAVLVGRDGRMFYLGEEAVRQSAGLVLRDQRVADAVDLIAAMRDDLARRGIRFLVAAPPTPRPSIRTTCRTGRRTGAGGRNTISFSKASPARRQGGRPPAGHGRGAVERGGLLPPRLALDGARGADGL